MAGKKGERLGRWASRKREFSSLVDADRGNAGGAASGTGKRQTIVLVRRTFRPCAWVMGRLLPRSPCSDPRREAERTKRDATPQALGHGMAQGGEEFLDVKHGIAVLNDNDHPRPAQREVQDPTEAADAVAD
jgi:hypothetical protein